MKNYRIPFNGQTNDSIPQKCRKLLHILNQIKILLFFSFKGISTGSFKSDKCNQIEIVIITLYYVLAISATSYLIIKIENVSK